MVLSPSKSGTQLKFHYFKFQELFSLLLGYKLETGRGDWKLCKPSLCSMSMRGKCSKLLMPCSGGRGLECINLTLRQRWLNEHFLINSLSSHISKQTTVLKHHLFFMGYQGFCLLVWSLAEEILSMDFLFILYSSRPQRNSNFVILSNSFKAYFRRIWRTDPQTENVEEKDCRSLAIFLR